MPNIQIIVLVIVGSLLLYFGYSLFFPYRSATKTKTQGRLNSRGYPGPVWIKRGKAGEPKTCPLCEAKLKDGQRVHSVVYPAIEDGVKRMFIYGCVYCQGTGRQRRCPVCGKVLAPNDYLIAKLFLKPGRSHVHVQACTICQAPLTKPEPP